MQDSRIAPKDVASKLVAARLDSSLMNDWPGAFPETLDEAYAIQDAGIALMDKPIGGWKIGRIPVPLIEHFGTDRLAGPVMRERILYADQGASEMPVLPGFTAVEGEVMVRLARLPEPGMTLAQVRDCAADVRLGIELASSPFPGVNDNGPTVTIADFGNNFGLLIGPEIPDWRNQDLIDLPMQTLIDGELIGEGTAAKMLDGPYGAVAFVVANLRERGIEMDLDWWISTGAITGVHRTHAGVHTEVRYAGLSVACNLVPYMPTD